MKKYCWTIVSIGALFFTSCANKTPPPPPPKSYPVITVARKTVVGFTEYPASIRGKNDNDIRAKISGYIKQVLVDEGQRVSKGQILFRLETNMLSENTDAAKANISAAKASVEAAKVEVNKLKPLVEQNIISNVQLQTAQANLLRAQAQLQQAQASFQSALANEEYAVIRAPISGVIGKINLRVGSLVGPTDAQPISKITDQQDLFAYFSMNEKDYLEFLKNASGDNVQEKLRNFHGVQLVLANGDVYPDNGKIEAVTGNIDQSTGSIQFRVTLNNRGGLLSSGNSGTIRIPKQYHDVLVVPESATYEQQGYTYVYKVEKDTARNIIVDVLDRVNNLTLIKSGIEEGVTIVGSGIGTLKNGAAIKPQPANFDSIVNDIKPIF